MECFLDPKDPDGGKPSEVTATQLQEDTKQKCVALWSAVSVLQTEEEEERNAAAACAAAQSEADLLFTASLDMLDALSLASVHRDEVDQQRRLCDSVLQDCAQCTCQASGGEGGTDCAHWCAVVGKFNQSAG